MNSTRFTLRQAACWAIAMSAALTVVTTVVAQQPPTRERAPQRQEESKEPSATRDLQPPQRDRPDREQSDRSDRDRDRDRDAGRPGSASPELEPRVLPPDREPWGHRQWVLGVYSQTTATGIRVRDVVPGSAAERAGLERDDVIVTVNGYQVGRVGSRTYPLGEELQLRVGRRGEVLLLVQNRRNDQLLNLPVELDRRGGIEPREPRPRPFGLPGQLDPRRRSDQAAERAPAEADAPENPLDREGVE